MRVISGLKVKIGSLSVLSVGGVKKWVFWRYLATATSGIDSLFGKVLDMNKIHNLTTAKAMCEFPIVSYLRLTVLAKISFFSLWPSTTYEPERSAQSINSRNIALGMEYSLDIGSITFDPMVVELMLSIRGHMRVREGSKYGHFPTQLLYAISDPRIQVIFG